MPARVDLLQRGVDVLGEVGLDVDGHKVCARVAELLNVAHGLGDHQMHVQRQPGHGPDGLDHRDADGDIRHELAVHDVHMDVVGGVDLPNVPLEIGEVGGENGRCDLDVHGGSLL